LIGQSQCPKCQASVPVSIMCCPACGQLVHPNAPEDPVKSVKNAAESRSVTSAMLAGMAFFFGFGFLIPGLIAEQGFLWISVILALVGVLLLAYRYVVLKQSKKEIKKLEAERHVKCSYCGGTNDREAHKCAFCGAPLW
jgi:hypothetical protein